MSTLAIVLIAFGAVVLLFFVLGFLGARARDRQPGRLLGGPRARRRRRARAGRRLDRGWQREAMENAARSALSESRPGWTYEDLHLVLVDDRPGIEEDRAHFVAVGEGGDEARVVLARQGDRWVAESGD